MPMPLERWLSGLRDLLGRMWSADSVRDLRCPQCHGKMHAVFDPLLAAEWDAPWSIWYYCPRCDGSDTDR